MKNRGNPHFRLTLPDGTQLWSATVNGAAVVPVKDAKANLIPLPQRADPNAVLTLDLKLAALPINPKRVTVAAPIVDAPVMLAEWKLEPDTASGWSIAKVRSRRSAACRMSRALPGSRARLRAATASRGAR